MPSPTKPVKPMALTLHGRALNDGDLTSRINCKDAVKVYLDKLPDGVVVEVRDIIEALDLPAISERLQLKPRLLPFHSEGFGSGRPALWGNVNTISEIRKRRRTLPKEATHA